MTRIPPTPDRPRLTRDAELEEFRNLMTAPAVFVDGFNWPAFFGSVFVALVMVPASLYMALIAGASVGPAAQWVTLILFIEVARRANKYLNQSEIFTLFYITGAIMASGGAGLLWNQFYAQSTAAEASGITQWLPTWFSPAKDVLQHRSLLMWQWLPAIGLMIFTTIMGRLDNAVLGYGLFRIASDIEKLPFPMAPVGAQGVMALSEEQEEESRARISEDDDSVSPATSGNDTSGGEGDASTSGGGWRWRVFSIGSVMGLAFGMLYLGLPTITGALLSKPIQILPIPFVDYTPQAAQIPWFKAVALGISLDIGMLLLGMVLPYRAMVGSFIGLLITFIANPFLYHYKILTSWVPSDNLQRTFFKNQVDFYFSFSIGISAAIAVVGLSSALKAFLKLKHRRDERLDEHPHQPYAVPEGRGDMKAPLIAAVYLFTTLSYILVSGWLIDWHRGVMIVMLIYGFLYTPIVSYVTARLEGIAGEVLNIPFVREAAFILCGYHGVAVWFLPIPLHNYGAATVTFRQAELTGTSFWSIWKSELLLTPIILAGTIVFAGFIWSMGDIPGPQYPYAQQWWEVNAEQQALVQSATLGGYTPFEEAINLRYILAGAAIGLAGFAVMGWLGASIFMVYGIIRGLNQSLPFAIIPQFIGALLGQYYFRKKMGLRWRQYTPVVFAGFSCGMGLVVTLCVGFTFLAKSVFQLPY